MSRSRQRRFRGGGAALEFALVLPLLLGFVLAGLDLASFVAQVQRASAAASAAADVATQIDKFSPETDIAKIVTGRELAVLALAATEAAHPQPLLTDGAIIITSMANTGGGPSVAWQRRWGRPELPSLIGSSNTGGLNVAAGEGVIFAEVVCSVRPWLLSGGLFGLPEEIVVRRTAVRRPRLAIPAIG
jgi:Flp pilus assembly protein TadG